MKSWGGPGIGVSVLPPSTLTDIVCIPLKSIVQSEMSQNLRKRSHFNKKCSILFTAITTTIFHSGTCYLGEWQVLESTQSRIDEGRGGGQVVSVLAFYSDKSSSNPAKAYSFFCKICVWKELK